jgi:TrmH family RNA methyltransferase
MAHSPTLGSIHNPRVREALRLREPRERRGRGSMLIDGGREIGRAIRAGIGISEIFVADELVGAAGPEAREAERATRDSGAQVVPVTAELMGRMAFGDRSDGLLAVARIPEATLASLGHRIAGEPLMVVLESVEKPGNLGAVLRTADGAGADAVIAADPRTDLFNPNTIRASLGTLFAVPVAAASSEEVRTWLAAAGIAVLTARVGAATDYADADLRGPLALVLGSEAGGLTSAWDGGGVTPVSLPMLGIADSLNVSITAAVLLYEARRQRGLPTRH